MALPLLYEIANLIILDRIGFMNHDGINDELKENLMTYWDSLSKGTQAELIASAQNAGYEPNTDGVAEMYSAEITYRWGSNSISVVNANQQPVVYYGISNNDYTLLGQPITITTDPALGYDYKGAAFIEYADWGDAFVWLPYPLSAVNMTINGATYALEFWAEVADYSLNIYVDTSYKSNELSDVADANKNLCGRLLKLLDNPAAPADALEMLDRAKVISFGETSKDLSIIKGDDDTSAFALAGLSSTVKKQLNASLSRLENNFPDTRQTLSDDGLTLIIQTMNEDEPSGATYSEGVLQLNCTSQQEKVLGTKGVFNMLYQALADVMGVQVYQDAQSVSILCSEVNYTDKTITLDLTPDSAALQLAASVIPADAKQAVTWHSSNDRIATVSEDGVVSGIKPGTVKITATCTDGSDTESGCKINVTNLCKEIIITGKGTLTEGKSTVLKAEVLPKIATNKKVTWESSDASIATVNSKGKVATKSCDVTKTVTITATAQDGSGVSCRWIITVLSSK